MQVSYLEIDSHEPLQTHPTLAQSVPVRMAELNIQGWADYRWQDHSGQYVHWERKTWADLTGDLDSIEQQLRSQMRAHPEARLGLIVEGVALPGMFGTVIHTPSKGRSKQVFYASRETNARYSKIMAWLYQVEKFIEVHQTSTIQATCATLVAFYLSDQKADHSTFARYLRTADWNPNPQVEMLMAIGKHAGIGPAKAEALIKKFTTVHRVLSASPSELQTVAGLGKTNSIRLLRKIGRLDV